MKRILLLVCALLVITSAANATMLYMLQAVANDSSGFHGTGPIAFGVNSTASSRLVTSTLSQDAAEVYVWDAVTREGLSRLVLVEPPIEWDLRVAAGPEYQFDCINLEICCPGLASAQDDCWSLFAGDTQIWSGSLLAKKTLLGTPTISYAFDFTTWGDLRQSPLDLRLQMVPEPSTVLTLVSGIGGLGLASLKRRRHIS